MLLCWSGGSGQGISRNRGALCTFIFNEGISCSLQSMQCVRLPKVWESNSSSSFEPFGGLDHVYHDLALCEHHGLNFDIQRFINLSPWLSNQIGNLDSMQLLT
mmetsp:Transcript_58387/g.153711  ORF Transcript_58387/g.153711 Transcript_58387/m.153711 type:complete len:103 (+) Transcript_58387:2587-2895(+)